MCLVLSRTPSFWDSSEASFSVTHLVCWPAAVEIQVWTAARKQGHSPTWVLVASAEADVFWRPLTWETLGAPLTHLPHMFSPHFSNIVLFVHSFCCTVQTQWLLAWRQHGYVTHMNTGTSSVQWACCIIWCQRVNSQAEMETWGDCLHVLLQFAVIYNLTAHQTTFKILRRDIFELSVVSTEIYFGRKAHPVHGW